MERRPTAPRRLLIAALLLASAPAQSLVSARWLKQNLAQVRVLAVAPASIYVYAHIPGALRVSPGRVPDFALRHGQRIVLYQYAGWPIAVARAFAQLDARGLGPRTAILNGGWPAWLAAHGAVQTGPPQSAQSAPARLPDGAVFAGRAFVAAHLHDPDVLLIDARRPVFYRGLAAEEPGEPLGHIPGALNLPFTALATRSGYFLPRARLAAAFRRMGTRLSRLLIVYCHSGRKAAIDYFAARLLGYHVRYYAGSWLNWIRDCLGDCASATRGSVRSRRRRNAVAPGHSMARAAKCASVVRLPPTPRRSTMSKRMRNQRQQDMQDKNRARKRVRQRVASD